MNYLLEVCLVALTVGITPSVAAQSTAGMQKGISVELPVTSNALSMPDADQDNALIVSVTRKGGVYFGVNPTSPAALAEKIKHSSSNRTEKKLYIKADARSMYADVMKVLEAGRAAGVEAPNLLTAQRDSLEPGTRVPPKGLEVQLSPPLPSGAKAVMVELIDSSQRWPTLKIDNETVAWSALQGTLTQFLQKHSEKAVLVKADGQLPFADIVHAIDTCRSMGAKVFLLTPGM